MSKLANVGVSVENNTMKDLGTVKSLIGPKGKIELSKTNLTREGTAMFIILNDGETKRKVFLSKAVSKAIKVDKSIKLNQIGALHLFEYELTQGERAGEIGHVIAAPAGGELTMSSSDLNGKIEQQVVTYEDLVAEGW